MKNIPNMITKSSAVLAMPFPAIEQMLKKIIKNAIVFGVQNLLMH